MFGKLFNQKKGPDGQGSQQSPSQGPSQDPNQQYNQGGNPQYSNQPYTPEGPNNPQYQQAPSQNNYDTQNPQQGQYDGTPQDGQSGQPGGQSGQQAGEGHPGVGQPKGQPSGQLEGQPGQTQAGQAGGQPGQQQAANGKTPLKADMSALSHLDPRASLVLNHAQEEARRIHQQYIEPEQLLFGLLYDEQISKLFGEFSVEVGRLSKEIQAQERVGTYKGQPVLSKTSQSVFDQAYRDAKMRGSTFLSPEDILIVLFSPNYSTQKILQAQGLKKDTVVEKLSKSTTGGFGRKSTLEKFAIDLTEMAREGKLDPCSGREKEIDRMVHILLRRSKNNPIIIGETGVGKTAIVEGLAQKIVSNAVPKDLLNKRIFQLDVASLVAGASHRGEFEERLKAVIAEVLGSNGTIYLFIDEVHTLMGAGGDESMNAANLIKPYLARGQLQIIGATTTTEYRKHFEKDKAFERRFQPVTCEEPSDEIAFEMMKGLRPKYEKFHRVKIPDDALKESIKLAKKYIGERFLPDKSIDLLDEACAGVKLQSDTGKRGDNEVKKSDIEQVVASWTGIPITKLTEDESEKLLKLEERIHKRLIDQQEAVVAVSEAVRRGRIGLASGARPTASFIFLGPSGVGKTELAKTLAELLFGRDDAMARLDMSEFMEKHEVAKLIGAPPGYVGYEEGGVLTEAVRKKPYSIVLMDEIEKAHPDVFNILLQLLEDGRLTDNKGNVISFKNTIVICTSNIGSALIQQFLSKTDKTVKLTNEQMNKQFKELDKIIREELIKFLRPEVLNRFDEVVIFKPLRPEHMAGIVRLEIAKTAKLLKEQGFVLQITEKAVAKLAKDGYDPIYGARPLRRLIQTAIENPIALAIIGRKFAVGDTIVIDYNDDINEFIFSKGGQAADIPELKASEFKVILFKIADPSGIIEESDKEIFNKLHEKVVTASTGLNTVYGEILSVTAATTDMAAGSIRDRLKKAQDEGDALAKEIMDLAKGVAQQLAAVEKQKKVLLMIVYPDTVTVPSLKEKCKDLHDKIVVESQNNNKLASDILTLKPDSPKEIIVKIMDELDKGKRDENEFAMEVLGLINTEITEEAQKETESKPATKFKKYMKQIGNPLYLAEPENKKKFSEIHDKIDEAVQQNHPLAEKIMAITDITSDDDIEQLQQQLQEAKEQGDPLAADILAAIDEAIKQSEITNIKGPLMLIANPITAQTPEEKEQYNNLHTKVEDASQKGNKIAQLVLNVTDTTTPEEIQQINAELKTAVEQNDEIAKLILDTISGATISPAGAQQAGQPGQPGQENNQNPQALPGQELNNSQDPSQNYPFGTGEQASQDQQQAGYAMQGNQMPGTQMPYGQMPGNYPPMQTQQPPIPGNYPPTQTQQPPMSGNYNYPPNAPYQQPPMPPMNNQGAMYQPPFQNQPPMQGGVNGPVNYGNGTGMQPDSRGNR